MSFGREKRLLLGLMALLAPIPLPFNEVLTWPVLAVYLLTVALFLRRAWRDRPRWLPPWALNLLGLAYLPFFVFDLLVLGGGRLVGPVVHLALFTVAVKLFSLGRERDKWQVLIGIFFLFLAAMATSVHPSIVLYLVVFLVLSLLLLARFAHLHLMAGFHPRGGAPPPVPLRGILALSAVASLAIAVPLFAFLPRVHAPYITPRGLGSGTPLEEVGFSDEVTLDSIGRIRTSREVALRIQFEELSPELLARRDDMRFKAATFDLYDQHRWERTPKLEVLYNSPRRGRIFELVRQPVEHWAQIWLQPLSSRSLVLPVETARVEIAAQRLDISRGGALSLLIPPSDVLRYRVALAGEPVILAPPPAEDTGALDLGGVTPKMEELAARVMGAGTARERAERLESHLSTAYSYTLDFVGRGGENPLEDFLFRYKSGHCEYFATAMVLMLRSQGIPARLVSGFLGAEYNPLEGYFIVRQGNAHVWVEAYLAEEGGWSLFDPTPPAGRPTGGTASLWSMAQQTYDYVLFRWDRYVLSYDFQDQLRFFSSLREAWAGLWSLFAPKPEEPPARPAMPPVGDEAAADAGAAAAQTAAEARTRWLVAAALLVALAGAAGILFFRLRRPFTVEGAYRRLRAELERGGLPLDDAVPPLVLRCRAVERWPQAARPTARVVDLYLTQTYAGRPLDEEEMGELETLLGEAIRGLRKAG